MVWKPENAFREWEGQERTKTKQPIPIATNPISFRDAEGRR